jgi:hypothetical protein
MRSVIVFVRKVADENVLGGEEADDPRPDESDGER